MSVQSELSSDGSTLTIYVSGKFDFSLQNDFRDSYKDTRSVSNIIVDLSQTNHMDSSALGMLLLLKQHIEQSRGKVSLAKPSEPIRKILEIANFDKIFTII